MEKLYFEDYRIGEKMVSPARTMTESDVTNFAGLTGDWHPIHTDAEYAKDTLFGERIVHGMLTLSIGSALIFRLGPYVALPKSFIAYYGIDSLRFTHPCKIGDTIHCEVKINDLIVKDENRGIIVTQNTIFNQNGKECIVYTARILAGRKPSE